MAASPISDRPKRRRSVSNSKNKATKIDRTAIASKSSSFFTVGLFLILYVLIFGFGIPVYFHYQQLKVFNGFHIALSFFLALNLLIALWEITLGLHISKIEKEHLELTVTYKSNHFAAVIAFFVYPLSLSELFSFSFWTKVWSTYSLYDPSYCNRQSFGFFIDVGNGWSTLLPTLLAMLTMTKDVSFSSPRAIGMQLLTSPVEIEN